MKIKASRVRIQDRRAALAMAVTRIENKTIMTVEEMKREYSTKWFMFARVGNTDMLYPTNEQGYVLYIADFDTELYDVLNESEKKLPWAMGKGSNTPYRPEVGGIYLP